MALGRAPTGETPVADDEVEYAARAFLPCQRHIKLVRHAIGPEPEGARLRVWRSEQELDPYLEVVVEYDHANNTARADAIRCDREAPTRWE